GVRELARAHRIEQRRVGLERYPLGAELTCSRDEPRQITAQCGLSAGEHDAPRALRDRSTDPLLDRARADPARLVSRAPGGAERAVLIAPEVRLDALASHRR